MSRRKLNKEEMKLFREAQRLSKIEDNVALEKIMRQLIRMRPDKAIFHASLANTLWDLRDLASAESEFRVALKLDPDSERISLGFFHLLLELGQKKEALDEADRFLRISDSQEYRDLIEALIPVCKKNH